MKAARQVFNTTPFNKSKIGDIAASAGVSHGSFYTHFSSKEAVFLAVLDETIGEGFVRTSIRRELGSDPTPAEQIEAANRRFLRFYAENARILASMEELAPTCPEIEERRYQSVMAYTSRSATAIRRWNRSALPADGPEPEAIAYCLCSMVERLAQHLFLFKARAPTEEEGLASLTEVWVRTLGLSNDRTRTDHQVPQEQRDGSSSSGDGRDSVGRKGRRR